MSDAPRKFGPFTLWPFQEATLQAFEEGLAAGHLRQVAQVPTGGGKTNIGLASGKHRRPRGRLLFLAHRKELIDQPLERLRVAWPEAEVGVVKAERDGWAARDVVVATVQSLAQPRRLERDWGAPFGTIVCDEVHHAGIDTTLPEEKRPNTYTKIFARFPNVPVLGLSATPREAKKKSLAAAGFTAYCMRMSIDEAIRYDYLAPFRSEPVVIPKLDLSKVKVVDGETDAASAARALEEAHAAEHLAEAFRAKAEGRKAIGFAPTVATARLFAEAFQAAGIAADWVSGETPEDERERTLGDLRAGKLRIVWSVGVLSEGYDDPSVDCAVLAALVRSKVRYTQQVGRVLRKFPGKQEALLLDVTDAARTAGFFRAQGLLRRESAEERKVDAAGLAILAEFVPPAGVEPLEVEEAAEEKEPGDGAGALVRGFLDAARRKKRPIRSSRVQWIECAPDLYALPLGDEGNLVLYQGREGWVAEQANGRGAPAIVAGPSLDAALVQGLAEGLAREKDALKLSVKRALWRAKEASAKQEELLAKLAAFYAPGLTQGEASDLITAAVVRRRYAPLVREAALRA